jgi:hypothetical protein
MDRLHVRRRWAPWPFAVLAAAVGGIFTWAVVGAYRHPEVWGPGIRVFIPPYAIGCYWLLAVIFNVRSVVVTADRVSVATWPFLTRLPQVIRRDNIQCCYARHIVNFDEGREIERFNTAGIETTSGTQIDVFRPIATEQEAMRSAYDISRVLNQVPGRPPIDTRSVLPRGDRSHKWRTLAWGAVFILAILAGAAWEVSPR